jgi:5-methylcytosine-specific restriction protein A
MGSTNIQKKSKSVKDYVLVRADGTCESCDQNAPFQKPNNRPYLEPHHTRRIADSGPDHPRWVGAICPNCHREIHFGIDGDLKNRRLIKRLGELEKN